MKQFAPSTTTANLQRPSIVLDRHFGLATTPSVYFGDSHNTPISSFVGLGNSGPFAHDQQQVQLYLYVRNLQQQQQLLRQMSMQDPVIVPTAMRQTGSLSHSVVDSQVTDVPTKEADPLSVLLESDQALTVLPAILAATEDVKQLSNHQVLLRRQVEAFVATEEHVSTHSRGRTKPVRLGQVGIRCRHCAHMPLMNQKKGSVYFPSTFHGISQASQNMNFMHFDVSEGGKGICSAMPSVIVAEFATVFATKVSASRAGRSYWSSSAEQMGLVDTDHGIFVGNQLPSDLQPLEAPKKYNRVIPTCSATLATPKH